MSIASYLNHATLSFSDPHRAKFYELERQMLKSYAEAIGNVDAEIKAAMRRGYTPIRHPSDTLPQLNESLRGKLDEAVTKILEHESNGADGRAEQIMKWLSKEAYLTAAAKRRAAWGENLVLVVHRETGTDKCAKFVGRVFVDDVYSNGGMYQTPRGYSSWHAVTGRFIRRARYPLLSEAIAGGLYHYGCKCWHVSYFEGVTQNDYQGEHLPSFVNFDPGFGGNLKEDDALYAVRAHLSQQNIDSSAMRGFWVSRNVHYQRNVPASLDERIRQYLVYLLGENHGDTNEAYFIYHNLLNILAAHMLASGDFDPASISNEQISVLLTNLIAGRGSIGRDSAGQRFGGIDDMSSYDEFRRLYAFLQNFDNALGLDVAFVMDFFRYMDNHGDVSLTNISQSNVRLAGAGAVAGFLNDVSDEEAMFLFLSYVWATNSGMTYEESRAMFRFGQAGAGIILGAAGAMATGAASTGVTRAAQSATRRPPITSRPTGNAGLTLGSGSSNNLRPQNLMNELSSSGVRHNANDVVMVARTPDGKLLWLENGHADAGLRHIVNRHGADFAARGITDIPRFLNRTLQTSPVNVGRSPRGPYADFIVDGKRYRIAYGDNGFVVSFYPRPIQ